MNNQYEVIESASTDSFDMELRRYDDGKLRFWRKSKRSGIVNVIGQYTHINSAGQAQLLSITDEKIGRQIVKRVLGGENFASCFLFVNDGVKIADGVLAPFVVKSDMEEKYTSTGSKFWHHRDSMLAYREGTGHTIISTHISPEGRCNLACPYCSVTYRNVKSRLEMSVMQRYVQDLKTRGLKAVILTGGGEPTLYPAINELMEFLYLSDLKVALITNGTELSRVRSDLLHRLSWMRVSINIFPGWEERVQIPADLSSRITLGMSFIYTSQHQQPEYDLQEVLRRIKTMADRVGASYIRLLPNCLLDPQSLLIEHIALSQIVEPLGDARFFHQHKIHTPPDSDICHQSFFRPYLSEEPFPGETQAGSVFPCDSVVLNNDAERFSERYVLCRPHEILDYLGGKIQPNFRPRHDCKGCVFTSTVNMLELFKNHKEDHFRESEGVKVNHVEFV